MSKKNLILNNEFKNFLSDEFVEEFVNIHDAIPILVMDVFEEIDCNIPLRRAYLYEKYPELEMMDSKEIDTVSGLLKEGKSDEAQDFQLSFALDFLDKYPEYKRAVSVEAVSSDLDIMVGSIREAFLGDF